jgi:hypothetical protein
VISFLGIPASGRPADPHRRPRLHGAAARVRATALSLRVPGPYPVRYSVSLLR